MSGRKIKVWEGKLKILNYYESLLDIIHEIKMLFKKEEDD